MCDKMIEKKGFVRWFLSILSYVHVVGRRLYEIEGRRIYFYTISSGRFNVARYSELYMYYTLCTREIIIYNIYVITLTHTAFQISYFEEKWFT